MFKKYRLRDYDFKLILLILALCAVGILAIGSADTMLNMQSKQIAGVCAGTVVMVALSLISYQWLLKLYWLFYLGNIGILVLVLTSLGVNSHGAQRWFKVGGVQFQPSELSKILLILFFAQFIMKYRKKLNTFWMVLICMILTGIPWVLVYKQPDLSTSVVLLVVFCLIMFSGGISHKLIIAVLSVGIPAVVILFALAMQPDNDLLTKYQKERILAFRYPEQYATSTALQQLNSKKAIASGQLEGKGYKNNEIYSVKNGNFYSEAETDFIFAVIGEEFGFQGSIVVIFLFTAIALECVSISRKAPDTAGTIIAASMGGLVAFQGFVNIGVATFLIPNTGLPLPFVSYGLTSLLSLFIGMGFVLNVRLQAKRVQ